VRKINGEALVIFGEIFEEMGSVRMLVITVGSRVFGGVVSNENALDLSKRFRLV